ncbi:MAG TPA: diguanylate cyclase [Smithella sp.]|nr:diguanylate cyclase [Smithella sp.]HOG82065.1 diguanylate cyclase [Smithellaceae bacterium]
MFNLKRIFYIGVPSDMDPIEAKYVGMCNISALFFIVTNPIYMIYFYSNNWMLLFYEMFIFMAALGFTFLFNLKGKYTLALVWFGSILNYHLIFLSVIFGWEVKIYYLIFFTAGGAIMLFRRRASFLIVPSVFATLVFYYMAYFLSRHIAPVYHLSEYQIAVTNSVIEITFFMLVVINAYLGRYGSIASEDQLKLEITRSNGLLEKLQKLDRQKTMFFQNISHEIRTPLTLILGPLEMISAGKFGRLEQSLKNQLTVVQRNAGRLLGLINQLLDLSKLDENKMPLKITSGNISALVSDIISSFEAYADKLGIALTLTDESKTVEMDFDRQMMEKVLINLISNALKFTPVGGRINVSIARINDGKNIVISVKDSGRGIPQEELPYIFDRFHQVDGTMTRNQDGTGIGLSLVKEFVELHGGRIEVDSVVNEGSEFRVMLPKETALEKYEQQELFPAAKDEKNIDYQEKVVPEKEELSRETERMAKVLIIDDNEDMRDYIRQALSADYWIAEASDGREGLKKIRENMPDIIISDVMMPQMDGYELCRQINSSDALKNIPVILVTARASEAMTIEGIEAGAYDYVTKPFSPKILLAKIDNILERQERHKKQIQYDSLTGLLNREAWETRVLQELEKNKRYGNVFSIAFVDLDDFKNVNDTYNHHTGDEVLKTLSSLLTKNLRMSDIAGRFGGEEFVIYFPEATGGTAADSLERVLKLFSKQNVEDKKIHCTFSAGVVERNTLRELTLNEYLALADQSMYVAKKSGKARIMLYNA